MSNIKDSEPIEKYDASKTEQSEKEPVNAQEGTQKVAPPGHWCCLMYSGGNYERMDIEDVYDRSDADDICDAEREKRGFLQSSITEGPCPI